jgi:hypothetical protein
VGAVDNPEHATNVTPVARKGERCRGIEGDLRQIDVVARSEGVSAAELNAAAVEGQ